MSANRLTRRRDDLCPIVIEESVPPLVRGKMDFARGYPKDDCPFDNTSDAALWHRGWELGREQQGGVPRQ